MHRKVMAIIIVLLLITANASAQVLFYAHRGGRALWPENTLCAYEQALKLDFDFMDMDIQLSKDDVFVVTHNSGLNPNITLNKEGDWIAHKTPIRELTLKELKQYQIVKTKEGTEYSKQFPNQQAMENCHIVSLSETIDFIQTHQTKNVGFQIEIKVPQKQLTDQSLPKKYAKKLLALLNIKGILERTEVQSFDYRVLVELSKLSSNLKLAFLTDNKVVKEKGVILSLRKERTRFMLSRIYDLKGSLWEPSAK